MRRNQERRSRLLGSSLFKDEIDGRIYRNSFDAGLNVKNGFPVFKTVIEANVYLLGI